MRKMIKLALVTGSSVLLADGCTVLTDLGSDVLQILQDLLGGAAA